MFDNKQQTDTRLIMVICIAFTGGKYCGPHATRYVKIWPSSTKSLPTADLDHMLGSFETTEALLILLRLGFRTDVLNRIFFFFFFGI